MNPRFKTCYISAPPGTNLDVLRTALAARDVRVVVPDEIRIGSDWPSELNATLSKADLVVGVVTRQRQSSWVLFEMGVASARNRQIVLFVPPNDSTFPSDLPRLLLVRASISSREAIEFALDQVLAAPDPALRTVVPSLAAVSGLGPAADELLRECRQAINEGGPLAVEKIAAKALRQSGVEVIAERHARDTGADMVIWSDALQPFVGNPMIVEVKQNLRTRADAKNASQQVSSALVASGTRWALLLYGASSVDEHVLQSSAPPNVLVLSLTSLIEGLRNQPFADVVRNLRNRRVHGGG